MKVLLAKHAGFCNGVKNAVDTALKLADEYGKIFTLGELVHNELVTQYLNERGAVCISLEQASELKSGDVALIRAHGVPMEFERSLRYRGVID